MDWTKRLNEQLEALGLYPDVEVVDIVDLHHHIALVDTQEVTVYMSAEGCSRALSLLDPDNDGQHTLEDVYHALEPNRKDGIRVTNDHGVWHQDHRFATDEDD
jgi:hypothetical protein